MSRIVWLASYPKSGNTWCRVFLTNLMRDEEEGAEINRLDTYGIASSRELFDDVTGVASSNLTNDEISRLRPGVMRFLADHAVASPLFVKIHDAFSTGADDQPIVPRNATRAGIYLLRNPLDVAVSYAHHSARPIDRIIEFMANENAKIAGQGEGLSEQLEQKLRSWSAHVCSWVDSDLNLVTVRYEDLLERPLEEFTRIARHLGLPSERDRVLKAIEFSAFDKLQVQEEAAGFKERAALDKPFFRQGKAGGWREVLSEEQAAQIIADHGDVMRRFGY